MKNKLLTFFPYIYIMYCVIGLLCSFFNIESAYFISFPPSIRYWLFNILIIYCLVKKNRYTWCILLAMMIYTFPMIRNHSASYYNRVVFTMSPVFNLPLPDMCRYCYYYIEWTGLILQLLLIVFLLLKNTRKKYDIPF